MEDEGKTESQFIEKAMTPRNKSSSAIYFGLLPVILCLALVIGLRLFPPSVVVFEPHFLLPTFNTTLFLAAGVIAFIALRSYLLTGAPSILWLGCGVLALGTGALAAGWLIYPFGPNANVTIFNVAVLLAAVCHTGGVLVSLEEKAGGAEPGRRPRQVALAYLTVFAVIALLVGLTLSGLMPPFFIQEKGPTALRQYVVEWVLVLLSFAALVIMQRFLRKRASFLYWYSLALALVAISMLAFFLQPAVGSLIGWVGRSSYVLAAVYFLLSVNAALRDARTRGVGLSEALAEFFGAGVHWHGIIAAVSDAVVSYHEKGEILLWNKAAERIFGYPEAEVVGKGIDLILPDTKVIEAAGSNGGITEIEPARRDGSRFNAEISASAKGSALGMITTLVIRDITERKRAEEEIRGSEARFRSLFDNMAEGVALHEIIFDDQGRAVDYRIVSTNPAFEKHTGLKPEQIQGQLASSAYGTGTAPFLEEYARVAQTGEAYAFETFFPTMQRHFYISVTSPMQGQFVTVFEDVTESIRTEEKIQHLASFPQKNPQPILEMDIDGRITFYNQAALEVFGETEKAADLSKFLPDDLQEILATAKQTGERHFQREVVINGAVFFESIFFAEQFNTLRLYAVDITERKRADEALRESEKRLRQAHDALEQKVRERTAELRETVEKLKLEIKERQLAEKVIQTSHDFLQIMNRSVNMQELLQVFVTETKKLCLCEAVGIRLLDEAGNIPYSSYEGFSREFFEMESPLVIHSDQCMCINVIKGTTDPEQPFYSPGGSFYMNGTTRFLATVSEEDKGQTRNVCNAVGYESVALVPIRLGERILGLVHMADQRENMVPLEMVELLEFVALQLGPALQRVWSQEALELERQRFYAVLERIPAYVALISPDCKIPFANREFVRRFGDPEKRLCHEFLFGLEAPCEGCKALEVFETRTAGIWEWSGPDGNTYQIYDYPFTDVDGSPLVLEMGVDITALKNAEQALQKSEEDLRFLASRLLAIQEQERKRISYELHDDLCQSLTVLKMDLRQVEQQLPPENKIREDFESARAYLGNLIENVRRISKGLSPSLLEDLGLGAALKLLFEEFCRGQQLKYSLNFHKVDGLFSMEAQIAIYRIFQEILTNIAKYARASRVDVDIQKSEGSVQFCIADNGDGFDVEQVLANRTKDRGLGLTSMEERARMLGGNLTIQSEVGSGTKTCITVPYSTPKMNINGEFKIS